MRVLFVHPGPLTYSKVFLRLEPLGLELVAESARAAGHEVRLIDLQASEPAEVLRAVEAWKPRAVGFSLNYLANVSEVIELATAVRARRPECFVFAGGHSASFIARGLLEQAAGAIDCVVKGEGEVATPALLAAVEAQASLDDVPGATTRGKDGPPPRLIENLDRLRPARDLIRHRRRYFIGVLDPCASVEFTRGCPWDCTFCSAWTFYGRSYRKATPEKVADDLASIREPGVFIVDDVAFVDAEHGHAIASEVERRGIRKQFYLETRADVLMRNREVFAYWKRLGLEYMFLGLEALDEETLRSHRKRVTLSKNLEALDVARALGITVAVNIIADPSWDERQFQVVREWALSVPEIVHLTVNTPYPGTETWHRDSRRIVTRDYRLFDVQHAVLPTTLTLSRFYEELVRTQQVLNKKHLGWAALRDTFAIAARLLAQGQTNFVRMLWKFNSVYAAQRLVRDHRQPCRYELPIPDRAERSTPAELYVHLPEKTKPRAEPRPSASGPRASLQSASARVER